LTRRPETGDRRPGFELVVVGASWGGIEAIQRVLGGLQEDFPLPIAIAQHRAIDSGTSAIASMLSRLSGRDVCEAADKDQIERGRVYLAPADYHLMVEPGNFALSTEGAVQHSRPSIDVLFDTAADAYGDRLIGILLTGLNEDGAYGIARIHRRGGYTIAQDPATVVQPSMPQAAIDTGSVDRVAALEEIPRVLVELAAGEPRSHGRAA
jgi:two-component system, chemotaxis family, protein-glutamate methylesterase/glutaminase